MRKRNRSGYSKEIAEENLFTSKPIISLSTQAVPQHKWVDGKITDEIVGYQAWFVQDGTEPFRIKFEKKPTLPSFLSEASLEDLEGCEVGSNVYFRAKGLK